MSPRSESTGSSAEPSPPGPRGETALRAASLTQPETLPGVSVGEHGPDESDDPEPIGLTGAMAGGAAGCRPAARSEHHAESTSSASKWGVLRHRHYRNMLFAQFVSNIGGWMELFGMNWLVAQVTGSLKATGYLTAAHLVPILLLGTLGGLVADRVNRKTLLVVSQVMLMVVAALVAGLSAAGFPAWGPLMTVYEPIARFCGVPEAAHVVSPLIILAACNGAIAAFNMPAWQVLTPRLVPRDELTRAITVNGVQFNLTRVIGPALAGVAMSSWGTTPLFMVNAVSFLGVVLTAMTTPDAPAPAHDGMRAWRQVHAALRFIFLSKGPLAVFVAMTLMSLLAAPLVRVLSLFVIDVFQPGKEMEEAAGGYLLAVQGLGAVLGGLALKYIPVWYPKHHFIPLSVMACGLSVTAFALTTTLWAGYLAMFVCGFFWIWAFNQSWAAMQHLVSDAMRGRVLALANVFSFGATALGSVALGLIGESLKHKWGWSAGAATQASVAALSIPLMLAGLVMLLRRTPEVDGPMRGQPGKGGIDVVEAITARSHRPSAPLAPGAGGRVENPSQAKLGA